MQEEKRIRYTFNTTNLQQDPPSYTVNKNKHTYFYQIGSCKHPKTNLYPMRKFIIDTNTGKFVDVRTHNLTSKQNSKFYTVFKPHEYKRYSVYSFDNIDYPSTFDISTSQSSILNTNSNYTGAFAPF